MTYTSPAALVTGAGRGIGAAIAAGFGRKGLAVAVTDRDIDVAEDVALQIIDEGGYAIALHLDVTDRESVRAAMMRANDELGDIGLYVHSAGVSERKPLLDLTPENWDRLTKVNGWGTLVVMQEAAKSMIERELRGRIVNVTSITARRASAKWVHYAASKAMVSSLIQSGARALAPHGITVMGIAPGIVRTPLWDGIAYADGEGDAMATYAKQALVGRVSEAEDLVGTALFLASSASEYMTGQVITVDGGTVLV